MNTCCEIPLQCWTFTQTGSQFDLHQPLYQGYQLIYWLTLMVNCQVSRTQTLSCILLKTLTIVTVVLCGKKVGDVFIVSHCEAASKQDLCWFPSHCVDLGVEVCPLSTDGKTCSTLSASQKQRQLLRPGSNQKTIHRSLSDNTNPVGDNYVKDITI